jgi:hypothetical protein
MRIRLAWLVGKLIAFWSSLLQCSYHCSSNQKINFSQKISLTQGKYIVIHSLSITLPVCGLWLLPVSIWPVFCFGMLCHVIWYINIIWVFHMAIYNQTYWSIKVWQSARDNDLLKGQGARWFQGMNDIDYFLLPKSSTQGQCDSVPRSAKD